MAGEIQTTGALWSQSLEGAGSLKPATQAVYNRDLLTRAYPLLVHQKFGQRKPLKKASGKSMIFRRYERLDLATTPLTEGVTPSGTSLTKTDVQATIEQYGNWTGVTDVLDWVGVDDNIREASKLMGENMAETTDIVVRDIINAGTQFIRVAVDNLGTHSLVATARDTTGGTVTQQSLDLAINTLDRANARKYTSMHAGEDKEGSWPMAASYWAITHPDIHHSMFVNPSATGLAIGSEFTPVERYSSHMDVMPGEFGKYRNIRFIESTHGSLWADGGAAVDDTVYRSTLGTDGDVYSVLILARDAFGVIPVNGLSSRSIIHRAGTAGTADPLNQRNTVAWKNALTAVILNQNFMFRIECAALV